MKAFFSLTLLIISSLTVYSQDFYLAPNGVTCMCPNAAYGASGDPGNGIVYTKRTASGITPQNAATTCTSGIGGIIPNWFTGNAAFNEDISSWDVSNFENMQDFLSGCTSFNQDLGHWQFQYWVLMQGLLDDTNLSVDNYDSFISNLIDQNISPTTIGVNGLVYCDETSRNELINQGWTFDGDQAKEIFFEAPEDLNISISSVPCEILNLDIGWPQYSGCDPILIQNDSPIDFMAGETIVTWTMIDGNQNEFIDQQIVNIELITDEAQICFVSADQNFISNNRVRVTQDATNPNINVDYHQVQRETNTSGQYETIGFVVPPETDFLDSDSDNNLQSYRYKIQTVDVCGITHMASDFHKTILLQSNIATNNSVNLVWNNYEGIQINTYYIHRSVNGGSFDLIAQIAGSNNAYNDTEADVTQNFYDYFLEFEITDCTTDPINPIFARSNNEYINPNLTIDDVEVDSQKFVVYPNPTNGKLNLDSKFDLRPTQIQLYDLLGHRIDIFNLDDTIIDLSHIRPGMYLLVLEYGNKFETKSILKH